MNCCHNKEEKTPTVSQAPVAGQENVSHQNSGTTVNVWKAATLVVTTALVFTLAFGALWATGVVQIAQVDTPMAMKNNTANSIPLDETVLPSVIPVSVDLPITWGAIGQQLLETGVIDEDKLIQLYEARGGLSDTLKQLLYSADTQAVVMTKDNAQDLLNLFWAFGVANQSPVLSEGPMTDEQYGGDPSRFAATGGWTLRRGDIMEHYNQYAWVPLTPEQQVRVETVAKGIYRPCCNNSTYFPDCNHGMAMLGLLELLAANDLSEDEMYDIALGVNAYWFPSTYETIAQFIDQNNLAWDDVPAQQILGAELSSASGFANVKSSLAAPAAAPQGGGGCSV